MNYGLTLMARSDYAGDLDCFHRAARLTPRYSLVEINTAIARAALARHQEAEGHFRHALELDARPAASHFFYARWLVERGRYPEAAARLERALEIAPSDFDARHLLMRVHFDQQN